jgi:hypothetical protein
MGANLTDHQLIVDLHYLSLGGYASPILCFQVSSVNFRLDCKNFHQDSEKIPSDSGIKELIHQRKNLNFFGGYGDFSK